LGNLGTGGGGKLRLVLRGWKSGEKYWLLAWEIVERGWEGGGGEEYRESEEGEGRRVVLGLKEWLLVLRGLREMLVSHELMLKMTRGMLGK
jgi:hypothetical protein